MRTYKWNPEDCTLRVHKRNHTKARRLANYNLVYSTFGMAKAILTDFRGRKCSDEFLWSFAEEKIAQKSMRVRWEISGEEISAWLASRREQVKMEAR